MSCQPGMPCYNSTTNCSGDPCNPNSTVSCETVVYNGPALPNTGIETCTNLCEALQLIDTAIQNAGGGNALTFTNGLTKTDDTITLGGNLIQTTTINVNGNPFILAGLPSQPSLTSGDFLLMETSAGVVKKVSGSSIGKNITIRDNNNGLKWNDPGIDSVLDTLYVPGVPGTLMSQQIGDLAPATASAWTNLQLTLRGAIDAILFPLRRPVYQIPTISWEQTGFPTVLTEVGTPLTFTFSIAGNKFDADSFSQFAILKSEDNGSFTNIATITSLGQSTGAVLPAQSYGATDPNSPNIVYTASWTVPTSNAPAPGTSAIKTVSYKASGNFLAGQKINMSDGTPDDRAAQGAPPITNAPIGSGTLETSTVTMQSTYPFFYGWESTLPTAEDVKAKIEAYTGVIPFSGTSYINKLTSGGGIVSSQDNVVITISTPTNFVYLWLAHYDGFPDKIKLLQNNSELLKYDVGSAPANSIASPVTKAVTGVGWGTSPNYRIYIWKSTAAQFGGPGITYVFKNS